MERAEVYTLEAASAPLSPTENLMSSTILDPYHENLNYNGFLETLHEKSRDDTINDIDHSRFHQSLNISSSANSSRRKRKNSFSELPDVKLKRRKEKCASEKKVKVSNLFKTPLNYFSNRRRTIDTSGINQSLNQSVISSSGLFNVDIIDNLSVLNDSNQTTPVQSNKSARKNIFARTFSSSKFSRNKLKKCNLNATRLSFCENSDNEGLEQLNATCFPSISYNPSSHSELRSDYARDVRGPSGPTLSVLTSSNLYY